MGFVHLGNVGQEHERRHEPARPTSFHARGQRPNGVRAVVAVTNGTFKGERLEGTVAPTVGGDFALFRPDGSLRIDVRLVLITNDGATIYMTYNGVAVPDASGGLQLKTAPTFEAGGDYAWLNNVQAIGIGHSDRAAHAHRAEG